MNGVELHHIIKFTQQRPQNSPKDPRIDRILKAQQNDRGQLDGLTGSVYQYRSNPPGFIISPRFPAVETVARELNMPSGRNDSYFTRLWNAGEFVGAVGKSFDFYRKYTVETLGVRVREVPDPYIDTAMLQLANPTGLRPILPLYWLTPLAFVQISRIRILLGDVDSFQTNLTEPLLGVKQWGLCFDLSWDGNQWGPARLSGLELRAIRSVPKVEQFLRVAHRILARQRSITGRPYGTGEHKLGWAFFLSVRKVYSHLEEEKGHRPTQAEVACAMGISLSSFKRYWRTTARKWPPVSDPFSERLEKYPIELL